MIAPVPGHCILISLLDSMLCVRGKQLRSCRDSLLLTNTVGDSLSISSAYLSCIV